jgi:hypothetical protein
MRLKFASAMLALEEWHYPREAAGLPFCTYVPRLLSLALVAHHVAIDWFNPRQHNCGGGVGALIRRKRIVACREVWVASQQPSRDQWRHESIFAK